MNTFESSQYTNISEALQHEQARRTANMVLDLGGFAIQFAAIERAPRYTPEKRENDAEHSFMLSLVAHEVASQLYPHLDAGLVSRFGVVHDLVELETGDVPTFSISEESLSKKKQAEEAALQRLMTKLPFYTAQLLARYEQQTEPEARFVRMLDKFMPLIADIHGPGHMVMEQDYGVTSPEELVASETKLQKRFKEMCPEFPELHLARDILANRFLADFTAQAWQSAPTVG